MIAGVVITAVLAYGIDTSGLGRDIDFGPTVSAYALLDRDASVLPAGALGLEAIFFQFERQMDPTLAASRRQLVPAIIIEPFVRAEWVPFLRDVFSDQASLGVRFLWAP